MEKAEQQIILENFRDYVIQQARSNLSKLKKNHTRKLYDSITGEIKVMPNSLRLYFDMEEYGFYQDQGVMGAGGVRSTTSKFKKTDNKGKMWKQKGKGSPFSFKIGNKPSVKHFTQWANSKGLSPFAVRESVFRQGISRSLFFTTPFEKAFKNLPDEMIEAYGLEAEETFNTIMEENFKNI
jgi:hypothetical protein